MADGKYYSNYSGKQIDQAYTAIRQLSTSDVNKIPVIIRDGDSAALKASDFSLTNIAVRPGYSAESAGQFVSANENGDLQASGYRSSSFFLKRSITTGHLVAMGSDGELTDAGDANPQEQIDAISRRVSTVESEFATVVQGFNALKAEVATYSDRITGVEEITLAMLRQEVAYSQIDEPDYDDNIYYTEGGTNYIVYEDDGVTPINGYMGSRDNSDYFVRLNTPNLGGDAAALTLADYIPRPYPYYTTEGKQSLKRIKDTVAVWGNNGTLTNTTVTRNNLETLVGANLIARTASVENEVENVKEDCVRKQMIVDGVATEVVRYKIVEGKSVALSHYYDIETEQDVESQILATIDGVDVPVNYGGLTVQLYAADGVTMIYPVTL